MDAENSNQTATGNPAEQQPAATRLPRGVRVYDRTDGRNLPFACQWWIAGARKTKCFKTQRARDRFAAKLGKDIEQSGRDAGRISPAEIRVNAAWPAAFPGATLDAVLACWRRFGAIGSVRLPAAVEAFLKAKESEGVAKASLGHWKPVYKRLVAHFGDVPVSSVDREGVADWVAKLGMAPQSAATHLTRAKQLFCWLVQTRQVALNPCDGLKPPKQIADEVEILTVPQGVALFGKATEANREAFGRLALEAFAGLRFSSAAAIAGADIAVEARGITLPASKIKTRRRQYIDGLPDNLWAWLIWSRPAEWKLTARQYANAKARAFGLDAHPHNCLRHSFATYHVAAHKDVSRTATILCHTSPTMLFRHYKGRATEADGKAWFEIMPPQPADLATPAAN